MHYFKNSELAETHHVSLRTVLNWIEAAKKGRLDLLLHSENGKAYVANTTRNIAAIEKLVEDRRKYRNTRSFKVVTPKAEFYKLYNEKQILDIISNLDIHHEIPVQYSYFGKGATYWDEYLRRLADETTPNALNSTQRLLAINEPFISFLTNDAIKINVVDLGVGNAFPVKGIIDHLLKAGVMGKYIAIDDSKAMIDIALKNIRTWFKDVDTSGYELDFSYQRFGEILSREYIENKGNVLNLVMLSGGTLNNLRSPEAALHTIHDSLGKQDILLDTRKLDTPNSRRYFDFNSDPQGARLSDNDRLIPDLLDIDESHYNVEMGFDEALRQRFIKIRLKVALTINFVFKNGEKQVKLNKEDTVLLWRVRHQNTLEVIEQFESNQFDPIQISQIEEYILTISKIKS